MLGLVAAQLKYKVENKEIKPGKAVWVDVSFNARYKLWRKSVLMSLFRLAAVLGEYSINRKEYCQLQWD